MFTASVDTSSVMWAMELNRKPAVLRKVLDDIHATVGGKDRVHLDDMPKLRHLKWVVKEMLRCTQNCRTCCLGREPPARHHLQLRCANRDARGCW